MTLSFNWNVFIVDINSCWMLKAHLDQRKSLFFPPMCHFNSFCFPFSLHHTRIQKKKKKSKGWLRNSQCDWFPHEDDPISPQWDFVLCVWAEWECQLPGSPGIGCWHQCINGPLAPLKAGHTDQLTKWNDEKWNRRWEASDHEDRAQRSALRKSCFSWLMWTETYITAFTGRPTSTPFPWTLSRIPSFYPSLTFNTIPKGCDKDSVNDLPVEQEAPFYILVSTETCLFPHSFAFEQSVIDTVLKAC